MRKLESQDKRFESLKRNHSLQNPKSEENIYKILVDLYGIDNVKRQYKNELYPWHCDFYITSINTYIEVQGYFTHGKHPFNPNNKEDIEILNRWKSKNTKQYKIAIDVWSKSDINKRNTAIKNNLNYIEIFNYENLKNIKNFLLQYKGEYIVY